MSHNLHKELYEKRSDRSLSDAKVLSLKKVEHTHPVGRIVLHRRK